ncbi:MAG TPA: VOC family protein [Kribbella sp.]|jgi:catechol 2,3-dioxygenase-like lactoylglutathione lyase family enzyme
MTADPAGVLARRFPGLWIWHGAHTGSWWALVPPPAGWRLVEAIDPEELTRAIIQASSWPWPSGTGGGSWRRPPGPPPQAEVQQLQASDAEVVQEPTEQPYGFRDCAFRDPAGNLIRIQELR